MEWNEWNLNPMLIKPVAGITFLMPDYVYSAYKDTPMISEYKKDDTKILF